MTPNLYDDTRVKRTLRVQNTQQSRVSLEFKIYQVSKGENNMEEVKNESTCNGNCEGCTSACSSKKQDLHEPANEYSRIKRVIGVVSGKGGVGKSLVTSALSVIMNKKGYNVAILDADITGPSIPKSFGMHEKATGSEIGIMPVISRTGIKVMSVNLLLDEEEMPVLWRGPILGGTVKQFWTDVIWDDVDYMFVDMPPGTGDVQLTAFQSLPIDGIVIVTSPQELVSMIVGKAVNMAKAMNIPIIGVVENYSYIECPDCKKKIPVFGKSHVDETCEKYHLKCLAKLPLSENIAETVDKGNIEDIVVEDLMGAADLIESAYSVK